VSGVSIQDLAIRLLDTPGPVLTLYESGKYENIGASCSEQWEAVISHSPRRRLRAGGQGGPKPDTYTLRH